MVDECVTEEMNVARAASASPATEELGRVRDEVEAIKTDAAELLRGLTEGQLAWRPAPDVWSIADCLAHLNVVNDGYYLKSIRRTIDDARARGMLGAGPFRHGFLGNMFVRLTEPPPRFKIPAPRAFLPPLEKSPRETVELFMKSQEELLRLVRDSDGIDLGRAKVVSPINKHLKFTLGQALRLMTAHERRHLWQARRVKAAQGFPAA